jgi:hypothetical protein
VPTTHQPDDFLETTKAKRGKPTTEMDETVGALLAVLPEDPEDNVPDGLISHRRHPQQPLDLSAMALLRNRPSASRAHHRPPGGLHQDHQGEGPRWGGPTMLPLPSNAPHARLPVPALSILPLSGPLHAALPRPTLRRTPARPLPAGRWAGLPRGPSRARDQPPGRLH